MIFDFPLWRPTTDRYTYARDKPFVLAARAEVPHDPIQDGHYFLKVSADSDLLVRVAQDGAVLIDGRTLMQWACIHSPFSMVPTTTTQGDDPGAHGAADGERGGVR